MIPTEFTYIRRAPDWNGGFGLERLLEEDVHFFDNMHSLRQACPAGTVFFICPPMADSEFVEINEHVTRMLDKQFPG
ncbi:hypothetical protein [Alkalicoccus luteus]|uniref:hypothetical protein n=1 Tax=Alkalicoccus luteus TaxID=1237094 RepID=UPI0040332402